MPKRNKQSVDRPDCLPLVKNEVMKDFVKDTKTIAVDYLSFFSLVIMHNEWVTFSFNTSQSVIITPPPAPSLPWFR